MASQASQAHTWYCLGDTYQYLGDQPRAIDCLRHALGLFRELDPAAADQVRTQLHRSMRS